MALAQVDPAAMAPRPAGERSHARETTYGGVGPRWVVMDSEPRRPQAPRTVDNHLLRQGTNALNAFKQLCRTAFAGEADAPQALAAFAHRVHATALAAVTSRVRQRDCQRGRPRHGAQPDPSVEQIDGGLASSLATREALGGQQRCVILATNALDETP